MLNLTTYTLEVDLIRILCFYVLRKGVWGLSWNPPSRGSFTQHLGVVHVSCLFWSFRNIEAREMSKTGTSKP